MPISFSMVQLDGEYYWDASIATKASLQYLLNSSETDAFLLFQTEPEHFDRRVPTTFAETVVRVLDIGHISRLRMVNDFYHSVQRSALVMRRALEAESDDPAASHRETIAALAARPLISIVSVRDQDPGAASASLTRDSIRDAWARGDRDVTIALREGTVPPMAREDR